MSEETFELSFNDSSLGEQSFYKRHVGGNTFADPIRRDLQSPAVQLARKAWEDRTVSEYIGVMGMHYFHGLLVDVNAPMDVQELVLLCVLQEQQHCRRFRGIASHLGSSGQLTVPIDELSIQRTDEPLNIQITKYVFGTLFCGEQIALDLLKWSIHQVPDSPYRNAMREIRKDEVLHSQMGTDLLAQIREASVSWCAYPGDAWVRQFLEEYIEHMLSRNIVDAQEVAAFEDPAQSAQLLELGIPNTLAFKEQYLVSVENLKSKTDRFLN